MPKCHPYLKQSSSQPFVLVRCRLRTKVPGLSTDRPAPRGEATFRVGRPQRDLGRGGTLYAVVIVQFAMKRRKLVNSVEGTQMAETLPTNDERRPS